jgi:hypothetical protein
MPFYSLIIGVLGVWRLTHLLNAEDGPWDILVRFRRALDKTVAGKAVDCFYCLSLWISIPFAWYAGATWSERFVLWLAMSGGAILLERATTRAASEPQYFEDPFREEDHSDVQLRS